MPLDRVAPSSAFRTRPRKMLSIPTMPNPRPALVRRPFGPRPDKLRPSLPLTVTTLLVTLPIAMLVFFSTSLP